MSKVLSNVPVGLDEQLEEKLQWLAPDHGPYRILRQSVDARSRHNPHFVYTVEVAGAGEVLPELHFDIEKTSARTTEPPLIIGSGPAGLFAALRLVERGIPCHLFERGSQSEERIKGINKFWRYGQLDPRNNVCYGEGGAGLYSDGKLITRIKSDYIPYVLNRLVQFGAPPEIEYFSNPHVGSDRIRRVIPKLRQYLLDHGCRIHFDTKVEELILKEGRVCGLKTEQGQSFFSSFVVLATGHSAEDMLQHLHKQGVFMEGKSFAMGLRVEHPQSLINQIQYRDFADHPKLGSANYKLTHHDDKTGVGVYSFCMCPGGYILSSGTEAGGVVSNGMSNYHRNSPFANAALVVSIDHKTLFGTELFGGLKFRRELETKAYQAVLKTGGSKELPVQNLIGFLENKIKPLGPHSCPSGVASVNWRELLPEFMNTKLLEGLHEFERKMKGFIHDKAQLFGIESRTSCPVRITRHDDTLESISHAGLFPAGEGAGYAGGITSAACDGVKIAEKIYGQIQSQASFTVSFKK
jgi:uncharacterized FAD-dependent dehydrogenase